MSGRDKTCWPPSPDPGEPFRMRKPSPPTSPANTAAATPPPGRSPWRPTPANGSPPSLTITRSNSRPPRPSRLSPARDRQAPATLSACSPATGPLAASHWTASHPHAPGISQMRHDALGDPGITNAAWRGDQQNYEIEFGHWARRYAARLFSAGHGRDLAAFLADDPPFAADQATGPALAAALADDPSFAADLTTTLSHQVHVVRSGERPPEPAT